MQPMQNCYHIVKFSSKLPYESCSGYECVPKSWVTFHDEKKGAAVIAYPPRSVEVSDDIQYCKKFDSRWTKFVVQVIFSTDNYEEALVSLQLFQSDTSNVAPEEIKPDPATPPKTPQSRADVPPPPSTPVSPIPQTEHKEKKILRERKTIEKPTFVEQLPPERRIIEKPTFVEPGDPEALKRLDGIEAMMNTSQTILRKLNKAACLSTLTDRIADALNKLNSCENLLNAVESRKSSIETLPLGENRLEKRISKPNAALNDYELGKTKQKPKKKSSKTSWTLRYPKPGNGVVELIRDSQVYIKTADLKEAKTKADFKMLVRFLLYAVFTEEALMTCSLAGKTNRFIHTGIIRPELDPHARITIFKYVCHRAKQRKWAMPTKTDFSKCVSSKLTAMRRLTPVQEG